MNVPSGRRGRLFVKFLFSNKLLVEVGVNQFKNGNRQLYHKVRALYPFLLVYIVLAKKLKRRPMNYFSKLSVHNGEDEEGGCPLPEWKPCGCREKARRRQVTYFTFSSYFIVVHFFLPSFSFISFMSFFSLSLFLFFLSHLSLVSAGRRLTDAMFPFSSLAVYELSSPFLHSSFLSLSLVPPSSWTSRRYNSSISCLSHLSHSHLHLHGKP